MCLGCDGQGFPCNSFMSDCQSALVKQPPEGSTLTDSPDFFCLLLSCKKRGNHHWEKLTLGNFNTNMRSLRSARRPPSSLLSLIDISFYQGRNLWAIRLFLETEESVPGPTFHTGLEKEKSNLAANSFVPKHQSRSAYLLSLGVGTLWYNQL